MKIKINVESKVSHKGNGGDVFYATASETGFLKAVFGRPVHGSGMANTREEAEADAIKEFIWIFKKRFSKKKRVVEIEIE